MKKFLALMLVVVFVFSLSSVTAFAGPRVINPYKDLKKTDKTSIEANKKKKKYNGWKGIAKKNKFKPNKFMTRREFLVTLHNLYGRKVTAGIDDIIHANDVVTSDFCCKKMAALSKGLGYEISWNGYKAKMRRKDVARYIKIFATFHKKLTPHKY